MKYNAFPPGVLDHLGYYVYYLRDPNSHEVFYVGKGTGDRVFHHVRAALQDERPTDKLDRIRTIHAAGYEVEHVIHRHGLTENEAFEVEAALIDLIGLETLANQLQGKGSRNRGPMTIEEIIEQYAAPEITISEPAILVVINRMYRRGMTADELFEAIHGYWVIGERRNKARYAFAVYNGIVRQVYRINEWHIASVGRHGETLNNRWYFDGVVATELAHYVGGSVISYRQPNAQNPIAYVNIDSEDKPLYKQSIRVTDDTQKAGGEVKIGEPMLLLNVGRLYRPGMGVDEIYEIARGNWVVGNRRERAQFAAAVSSGIIRQAFEIERWYPAVQAKSGEDLRGRWAFHGHVAEGLQHLVGFSVKHYLTAAAQNPVKYVNC